MQHTTSHLSTQHGNHLGASQTRELLSCRRCSGGQLNWSWAGPERRGFLIPGSMPRYAPDLTVRLERLELDLVVHPEQRWLRGVARHTVRPMPLATSAAGEAREYTLDLVGAEVASVVGGTEGSRLRPLEYRYTADRLSIALPSSSGEEGLRIEISYSVRSPRRGLYFTGPDADYPSKPVQVWSQGQDEDNRHWIPLPDYPNQKFVTSMRVRVPEGYTAISGGARVLDERVDEAGAANPKGAWRQYEYRLALPQVSYLITLAIGRFEGWSDVGPRELPIEYWVERGRKDDGKRAFSRTPEMVAVFERLTGVPYPYEKYSQVAVQDFIFGGMENTSATTQTDRTLHDARASLDFSSAPLVSHELAHQWFGDLVTCRDWSHGWLNEGFATFLERVWVENDLQSYGSIEQAREEGKYYAFQDWKEYRDDDRARYRRSIVCQSYAEPIDLFDSHLYQKGGLVLGLLRERLGETGFWRAVHLYLERHRGGSVETLDLIRAIEDATGRNLRRFFDDWVFGAGYPELEASYRYVPASGGVSAQVEVILEQKQTAGASEKIEHGFRTPLFDLPLLLRLTDAAGRDTDHRVHLHEARTRVIIPVTGEPKRVRLDPGGSTPKQLSFARPKELLLEQLSADPDCLGRIEAIEELVKIADLPITEALGRALREDPFWGVAAEAAAALARLRTEAAQRELERSLEVKHPKARRAVVRALGTLDTPGGDAVSARLRKLALHDPSYFVAAEATRAYARVELAMARREARPQAAKRRQGLGSWLLDQARRGESYLDVVRSAALAALGDIAEAAEPSSGGRDESFGAQLRHELYAWAARGRNEDARLAAIGALIEILARATSPVRNEILARLESVADEPSFRVRMRLIAGLPASGVVEAAALLERIRASELDGRCRREAWVGAQRLYESAGVPQAILTLTDRLSAMQEQYVKLARDLEALRPPSAAKKSRLVRRRGQGTRSRR